MAQNNIPTLFTEKNKCCACAACVNVCPKGAITMGEDQHGFLYPTIDPESCIGCGACKRVCAFQNTEESHTPLATYAATAKDNDLRVRSASGGIFAALAAKVLEEGGIVCGAAFTEQFEVAHILIDDIAELDRLQGSKYVQSRTGDCYAKTKDALRSGKKVLYSGTPCQIAGLYGYLGGDHENLLTVDLVCHGVPNARMLAEYIKTLSAKYGGEIVDFTFRDKKLGWGINGSVTLKQNGKIKRVTLWQSESAYLYYFTKGWLYRENCYECKYASAQRPADLTLGDFWGIEKAHPEYLRNGFDEKKGISLIVVNSEKGTAALEKYGHTLELRPSTFVAAAAGNGQLRHPSPKGKRDEIMAVYEAGGWAALEERYRKNIGWHRYASRIKAHLPSKLKRLLKRVR